MSQRHIILDSTNLKAVPAAALAIGAVAYQAHFGESDDTKRWIEQAVFSTRSFGEFFVSDGSYHEGVSYANYTAQNILKATSVFKRHNIEDLTDLINWPGYADYAVGMAMPIHSDPYEIVNFGDNGNAKTGTAGKPKRIPKRTAVALWIAANFRDAKAQWFGLNLGGEHDEWALIWYDSEVEVHPEPDGNQLWHSDLDWIVARTGFRSDDLTVAMRSGGPGNHEHADRNSIIVKNFGEHLVTDPYRPPYSFKDPNWMMRTTAGHSAVLVDGHGHQYHDGTEGTNPSDAVARIVRKEERRGYCYWTSDATPAYSMVDADIKSITRSVFVLYEYRAVIVFDMLNKEVNESTLKARYFGYNHDDALVLTTEGNSFTTHRPRAVLLGSSSSPNGVVVSAERLPIPEENASKHPFAEVATKDPSLNPHLLTVLSTSRTAAALPMVSIEYDDETYIVRLKDNDRTAELRVHATGYIPEFDLR